MNARKRMIGDEEIASSERYVILAHTDYSVDVAERRSRGEDGVMRRRHIPILRKGEVDIICDHIGGDTRLFSTFPMKMLLSSATPLERALYGIDCMIQEAKESSEDLTIVTTVEEIKDAKKNGKIGVVLSLQGGMPIGQDLAFLRIFYELGVRCIHLTACLRNQISDSCMCRNKSGLTDFGIDVVREMNRLGIVVDISQLSPAGCEDVLEISKQPVIASNSNVIGLCNHPRNLDDSTVMLLAENGGVVCIHCLSTFVTQKPNPTLDDLIDVIDYVVNLVGINHIGVGPDLLENWPVDVYSAIWGHEEALESNFFESSYVKGLESITDIPGFAQRILDRGYSEHDLNKILGGNLLRVFEKVWGR